MMGVKFHITSYRVWAPRASKRNVLGAQKLPTTTPLWNSNFLGFYDRLKLAKNESRMSIFFFFSSFFVFRQTYVQTFKYVIVVSGYSSIELSTQLPLINTSSCLRIHFGIPNIFRKTCTFSCYNCFTISIVSLFRLLTILE